MKIVIIGSVFYPRTSPRSLRITELAKFFATEGHEVVVYACTGEYDYTEFEKKHNIKVQNITGRHFSKLESDGTGKVSLFDKILNRLFGRLLEWPDLELGFKMKQILKNEESVDLLISVAVPYPIHWGIAFAKEKLKTSFPKVWISDCGDPYMGNSVQKSKPGYFQYIENYWAKRTDYITVPVKEAVAAYPSFAKDKIKIIPQGFNFDEVKISQYSKNEIPTFSFAGATYNGYRDPTAFLEFLLSIDIDFKFIVYTPPNTAFQKYKERLGDKLEIRSYIPRTELIMELSKCDFLININNSSSVQSPSKLIDYAITERPILSISSDFSEKTSFVKFLKSDYSDKTKVNLSQYDIKVVGKKFLDLYTHKL